MMEWNATTEGLLHDSAAGCLVGLAIGDALGGPVEMLSAAEISERYGQLTEMVGGGNRELEPGETSDDTAQALALAASILERSSFDPSDFAERLVDWYKGNPGSAGTQTELVLKKIAAGEDWEKAALEIQIGNPASAGNGSLMRCAPIALHDYSSPTIIIENSRLCSRVTHPHSLCQWSCAFINLVIAELIGGDAPMKAVDSSLAHCAHRGDVNKEVLERVRSASFSSDASKLNPSGFVLDTLECSLWCFLHTDSFDTATIQAVNLGGDADTIGAVTGALGGAAYGLDSIPQRWRDSISDLDDIRDIAVALVS